MNKLFTTARFLDFAGIISLIFFWIYSFCVISGLPEEVPIHFNFAGEPDRYGNRNTAYSLPAIAGAIFILLTVINRHPERFNYPFPITENNAVRQYRLAGNFIRSLRLSIVIIFLMIFQFTGHVAQSGSSDFQIYLLPAVLLLTFIPVLIYLIMASGTKNP